jgi:hypothetical protein
METKKRILFIALSVMMFTIIQAQTPGFEWAGRAGGNALDEGWSIAVDLSGNVLTTGYFAGTATFGSGSNTVTLTSKGREDIFIQKMAPDGHLLWAVSMGDTATDEGHSLTTDADGNVYVTGYFKYKMDADPGAGTYFLQSNGNNTSAFILKLGPGGNLIWAKQVGSPASSGSVFCFSVTLDPGGNVLICGCFSGKIDFDPGTGTYNLTSLSGYDGFIQKLDANGNFVWVRQIMGQGAVYPYAVKTDVNGNIYTSGYFVGTNDFNPDTKAVFNMTAVGGIDIFAEKLNAGGNFIWARQMGGTDKEYAWSLAVDGAGNSYITGEFYGTVDFDPGSKTYNLTSYGQNDMFLEKLDVNGNFMWVRQMGGIVWDAAYGVTIDAAGNVYVTGYSYGTADFNPLQGHYYLTTNGMDDITIYKSDADGNMLWVSQTGGTDYDFGIAIAVDAAGNIYTTGGFEKSVDFDPGGFGSFVLNSSGSADIFVQKLNAPVGTGCLVPRDLAASNIAASSADLGWSSVNGVQGYNVRYRDAKTIDWITGYVNAPLTTLTIDGLTGSTEYEFQVQAICGEENMSNFSYSGTFITSGPACYDNYEPNQSMGGSTPIPVNTNISGLISPWGDADWFSFNNVSTKKNVRITLTNLPADYNVALYNQWGTEIGISQNTGLADELIIYKTSVVETFYVKVYGASSAEWDPVRCYTLRADISKTPFKSLETVNDTYDAADITIYPNPATRELNIDFNSVSESIATLRLISLTGQIILNREIKTVEGKNHCVLDLSNFPNGLYSFELVSKDQISFRKVIVTK